MLSKVQKIFRGKAAKFALSKKDEGEHWLRKGKLDRALTSTNLAVVRAPIKDAGENVEELKLAPLSLWLRSEILYKMSEYELALNDIQLALKYHLPSNLKMYSHIEYGDMIFCYGAVNGSGGGAVEEYKARFPTRRVPTAKTIIDVYNRSGETGTFAGRPRVTPQARVLFDEEPTLSTRNAARRLNGSFSSIHRCLRDDGRGEAYQRMGMCYLNVGDKKKSVLSLNIAQSCGSSTVQEECHKTLTEIDSLLKPLKEKKKSHSLASPSTKLPGLSKSVTLSEAKNCGRFIKATLPITVGELVVCEEPYVSALFFEKHGTHCLHCYKRLKAPIPCPNCSGVGFCSNECQKEGMKYHGWECSYLELHVGSGMSILSHLALRIVTQQSLDYFRKTKSKDHEYNQVLKLEGHLKERNGKDLLRRALMALFLLQSLRHGGYFSSEKDKNESIAEMVKEDNTVEMLSEEELYIGCLLLHHLQVLQYNAHVIYETVLPSETVHRQGVTLYLGLGLYLSSSVFNHQCQPTLARYFQGRKLIMRAQRPINEGEEVAENYGPVFTMRSKEQRQTVLSGRYLFDCKCDACLHNWPSLANMSPETVFYLCKKKNCSGSVPVSGICQSCGQLQSIKDDNILFNSLQDDWSNAVELMKTGNFTEAENKIQQYVKDMWGLVKQPSKNLCLAMEALRTIWANNSGNISILPIQPKNVAS